MKVAVFAYSRQGCLTARKVMAYFAQDEVRAYTMERFEEPGFGTIGCPSRPFYEPIFAWADTMVFVGSVGIAVREIAPFIRSKLTDPAVVTMDELGTFVIPLLSGHIGGANDLALQIAKELNATPVVTTATDINHKFSVDAWAARNGYAISNMNRAKEVSAEILERKVPLSSDFPVTTDYPNGVVAGECGDIGICLTYERKEPFARTLRLIPAVLHLGIGCHRNIDVAAVREAVNSVLQENGLDRRAVKCVASIDLKADEEGLLEFCKENDWPVSFYTADELWAVPGEFTASEFVHSITGVDNVCERAALVGAEKLIVRKTAQNGVTVAVAAENLEVHFG